MGQRDTQSPPGQAEKTLNLEETLQRLLAGLRYGSVEIIVHNARVVQIERRERFRPEEEGFTVAPSANA